MLHFNRSSQEKKKICEIKELGLLIGVGDLSTKIIDSRYIDIFANIELSTKIKYRQGINKHNHWFIYIHIDSEKDA